MRLWSSDSDLRNWLLAAATGLVLWTLAALIDGKNEAWDGAAYWRVAYPLAIVAAAVLGYRHPRRPWRWPLAMMAAQLVALVIGAADPGLLPLGVLMFAVITLPAVIVALIGAAVRRRFVRE